MINKSLRDRQSRLEYAALNKPPTDAQEQPEDWMAELQTKNSQFQRLQNLLRFHQSSQDVPSGRRRTKTKCTTS